MKMVIMLRAGLGALAICLLALPSARAQDGAKPAATLAEQARPDEMTGLLSPADHPDAKAEINKPAINFTLLDAKEKKHELANYVAKNKATVLVWCNQDCPIYTRVAEQGEINMLTEKYKGQPVAFIQIDSTSTHKLPDLTAGAERFKYKGLVLADFDGKVGHTYEAKTTPHCYVIDAKGKLVYDGAIDNDPGGSMEVAQRTNYVQAALDAVLKGETPKVQTSTPYGCTIKYKPAAAKTQQ